MQESYKENSSNQRITHWVARLEEQAEALLEDIDLEELSTKDRLSLGAKYIAQLQRFLLLSQQIEAATPDNSAQQTLEIIKQRMRGIWPCEVSNGEKGDVYAHRDTGA